MLSHNPMMVVTLRHHTGNTPVRAETRPGLHITQRQALFRGFGPHYGNISCSLTQHVALSKQRSRRHGTAPLALCQLTNTLFLRSRKPRSEEQRSDGGLCLNKAGDGVTPRRHPSPFIFVDLNLRSSTVAVRCETHWVMALGSIGRQWKPERPHRFNYVND